MSKTIIQKEIRDSGSVILTWSGYYFTNSHIWFDDEQEFQAFVFMVKQLVATGAASITIDTQDETDGKPEEADSGEKLSDASPKPKQEHIDFA